MTLWDMSHTKPKVSNSGNSRSGYYSKKVRTSEGETANHSFTNVVFPKSTGALITILICDISFPVLSRTFDPTFSRFEKHDCTI